EGGPARSDGPLPGDGTSNVGGYQVGPTWRVSSSAKPLFAGATTLRHDTWAGGPCSARAPGSGNDGSPSTSAHRSHRPNSETSMRPLPVGSSPGVAADQPTGRADLTVS